MINVTNESSDAHKIFLKVEIVEESTEKLRQKIVDMVNEKV
jgi:hypothetical protein